MGKVTNCAPTVLDSVGDAVGVEKSYWFVAIVNNNTEKAVSEKLDKLGIENYLPVQKEYRVWKNGHRAKIDRVVIPSIVFVYCTEQRRKEIVSFPFIHRFMTDKAGTTQICGNKPLATIPDEQIKTLKFMLGQSDIPVTITDCVYHKGEKIRVIRGQLKGLEGEVLNTKEPKSEIIVALNFFGGAKASIDTVDIELIL